MGQPTAYDDESFEEYYDRTGEFPFELDDEDEEGCDLVDIFDKMRRNNFLG